MRIRELLSSGHPCFSFEFFPPKTESGADELRSAIQSLHELQPTFVSVTYGAGGGTRDRTVQLVTEIKRTMGFEMLAHLTCVGATSREIEGVLHRLQAAGVENVLALRGDPPKDQPSFAPTPGGFRFASELVAFIRERDDGFCLGGA
jgi:methylenetetrahydrofolate reductase (NADPH)